MKKTLFSLVSVVLLAVLLTSCASTLPVNSYYEKAGTLQKGGVELMGSVTGYSVSHYGRTEAASKGGGLRAGYGVSDRFDLKLRYEHQSVTSNFDGRLKESSMISIVPKYAAVPGVISLAMPISWYSNRNEAYEVKYRETYTALSPMLLFTFTGTSNRADLTMGLKSDLIFGKESTMYIGSFIGAGFSSDLDKWAIRPEIGVSTALSREYFWNFGIGFQWMLPKKK